MSTKHPDPGIQAAIEVVQEMLDNEEDTTHDDARLLRCVLSELRALPAQDTSALVEVGREFHEAVEDLCDWMNNNDLSADHKDQKPQDFERLCQAMIKHRVALARQRQKEGA